MAKKAEIEKERENEKESERAKERESCLFVNTQINRISLRDDLFKEIYSLSMAFTHSHINL